MAATHFIPTTTSSATFFRALAVASTARSCPHSLRTFSSSIGRRASSKRELYTAPSYQPHSLPADYPLPPRNTNVPDTSIAGPGPRLNDTNSLRQNTTQQNSTSETASIRVPEREAQQSKPVAPPPPPKTEETKSAKPRRSKLRPRKAAMKISPDALIHLRNLLDQPNPKLIRVGVKNRGCSGLAYHLEYVDKPAPFDEVVEQEGVKVLIDSKALFSIIGSEMDWQEDKLSARFVFKNPNITEQCGCGESFSVS
ncbi:Fe-S cluster assembly protein SufA [Exophiala viscosa]|uniref:Iron-sulfur assembly protein 1 n=1 Tax=Exophiala viscosa TaxID=2486360 RepID=A0AAN6DTQ6_9EURO|nr:Fe-S cluster assembly protein SufA [Exophiala viscosa]KAI1625718.1 Fe-S cluster assembly protein SufA [Exophiala viscosa]